MIPQKSIKETSPGRLSAAASELLSRIDFPKCLSAAFKDNFEDCEIIETHISVVVLGRSRVLKFKKAVDLGFVNHTTLDSRWESAVNEYLLNRRLSDDIYLGLVPFYNGISGIAQGPSLLEIEPNTSCENLLEVAVLMRRLDPTTMLDSLIATDKVSTSEHIHDLSELLCSFHTQQRTKLDSKSNPLRRNTIERITSAIDDNISTVNNFINVVPEESVHRAVEFVRNYSTTFIEENTSLFESREVNDFIIEGHGDLRAEHISFEDKKISIIDCIEFSDELRWVDVLNDLAFIRMDLDFRGRADLSSYLTRNYFKSFPEAEDQPLLDFYSSYRAMVRAKVEALQTREAHRDKVPARVKQFVSLAARYAHGIDGPLLIGVCGPMGTGKSTLAENIQSQLAAELIQSDIVRKELFGKSEEDSSLDFKKGKYSVEASETTYEELFRKARQCLEHNNPVILDASFQQKRFRMMFRDLATSLDIPSLFVYCKLDRSDIVQRLEQRQRSGQSISDGRVELLDRHLKYFEYPTIDEGYPLLTIDTSLPQQTQTDIVIDELKQGNGRYATEPISE